MNSRRLARLMGIICEIKSHPRHTPEEMCRRFNISRRQFYKDREDLAHLGFSFHYDRGREGFVLSAEKSRLKGGMSMADFFAMILAVKGLAEGSDFGLAYAGLQALRNLLPQLPGDRAAEFGQALEQLVIEDGFGCRPEIFKSLMDAVDQGQRSVLVIDGASEDQSLTVDPRRLVLHNGALYLEADGLEPDATGLVAASRVHKVIPMPLYSQ